MAELNLAALGEITLESLSGMLQELRKDILYVEHGFLYTAKDMDDLVSQGFALGTFDSDGGSLNPVMTWVVSSKDPTKAGEWWFFREDVVKALTGQP
jgi:hypothetical protein